MRLHVFQIVVCLVPGTMTVGPSPVSADDARSGCDPSRGADEASGKPPAGVDIQCGQQPNRTTENTSAGAPSSGGDR